MNFFYRSYLWAFIWLYVLATYLTLPVMRDVLNFLKSWVGRDTIGHGMSAVLFIGALILLVMAARLGWRVSLQLLLPLALLLTVAWQMNIPEERFHFFQYGLLGLLVVRSCKREHWSMLIKACLFVTAVGIGDELIQAVLPNRVGDLRDVGMNTFAGVLGAWMGKYLFWSSACSKASL